MTDDKAKCPAYDLAGQLAICGEVYCEQENLRPRPCVRVKDVAILDMRVKDLWQKINEELDELKDAMSAGGGPSDSVRDARFLLADCAEDLRDIADEYADVVIAATSAVHALGVTEVMRTEAMQRANARNEERGRL